MVRQNVRAILLPRLRDWIDESKRARRDSWVDDLDSTMAAVRLRVTDQGPDELTIGLNIGAQVADWNQQQWRKVVKSVVGVDIFASEPWLRDHLRSWARENAALISSLEDDAVNQVQIWTQRGIREGWRYEDIAKNIEDRFDVSRSRARLIARDQTAKLNGQISERRQQQVGVKQYRWRTSMDERVRGNPDGKYPNSRPSHWAREGKVFNWSDPPEDGHPGQPINCRCTPEPILDSLLDDLR